MLWLI
ncbi:hypothetical protein VCHC28A1_2661, partial [Vibrio cholerae HC-28A1]